MSGFEEEEQTQVLMRSEISEIPPARSDAEPPAAGSTQRVIPNATLVGARAGRDEGTAPDTLHELEPGLTSSPATSSAPLSAEPPTVPVPPASESDAAARQHLSPSVQSNPLMASRSAQRVESAEAAAGDDARDPLLGVLVDGRYRVLRLLGIGGIGLVYLCQHELLEKPVAMKVLRPEYVLHQDLNERFLNEARAASAIKSPHIVDTIDVGTLPSGAPYFVMEYVAGETLSSLLEREGSLDLAQSLDIARQAAAGLAAAHAAGVVHRDLKPENLFLAQGSSGTLVKLFDFGIAKLAGARKRLTCVGAVFGTPAYMSPEQAQGEPVDERTDIYSLGILIFEMLAGVVPFDAEDPLAIMAQHVDKPPPLLSALSRVAVPPELEAIVARCLSKKPHDRPADARSLLAELSAISAHTPAVAEAPAVLEAPAVVRPSPPETLHTHVLPAVEPRQPKRGRSRLLKLSVVLAVAASLGGIWVYRGHAAWPAVLAAAKLRFPTSAERPAAPRAAQAAPAVVPPGASAKEVHFVLFPLDARVYEGDRDLGPMPVSVRVDPDKPVVVTVRRKGFATRRVVVDGGETRVVVGLVKVADDPPAQDDAPAPQGTDSAAPPSGKALASQRPGSSVSTRR
ncbi:MAG TPA: serine/threonine-protein kinase [Polyangiaceae bacterium]|nr:serine/threonine-protein kinase [Polyangiaceae bacterium]